MPLGRRDGKAMVPVVMVVSERETMQVGEHLTLNAYRRQPIASMCHLCLTQLGLARFFPVMCRHAVRLSHRRRPYRSIFSVTFDHDIYRRRLPGDLCETLKALSGHFKF